MSSLRNFDLVVVGSGFFGATIAERVASLGKRVLVLERRQHVGGNAYSFRDPSTGIEIHKYGAHLFHTSNARVWRYANLFTSFVDYTHHVFTEHDGEIFPLPINLGTINQFFRSALGPAEARNLIAENTKSVSGAPANLEEKAISLIGEPLYRAFIAGYTQKQWQTDPTDLPAEVISRLPVRFNYDNRYFSDDHEGIPLDGYTAWIERMLDHPGIRVELGVDFLRNRGVYAGPPVVYTGPIDEYFSFEHGQLGWRTVDFDIRTEETGDFQGTSVINFADIANPYTRSIEFKHFRSDLQVAEDRSVVARERSRFARPGDEPYYPINRPSDRRLLKAYRAMSLAESGVFFGGRLATYKYLDMDMAIASALTAFENHVLPMVNQT